jgi:hypothetical protein
LSSPLTETPSQSKAPNSTLWSTLQRLEPLVKVLGAAATLVLALGIPAVAFQYNSIGLPLQFMTHEQIIRAGLLPTVAIGAALGLSFIIVYSHNYQHTKHKLGKQDRLVRLGMIAIGCNLVAGWGLATLYLLHKLHLEYQLTLSASWHVGWKVRLITSITWIIFTLLAIPAIKATRRLFRKVYNPNRYHWVSFGIALSLGLTLMLFWAGKRAIPYPSLVIEPFVKALAVSLFFTLFVTIANLYFDLRSSTEDERIVIIKQLFIMVALIYVSAALFYSVSWYRDIPHYLGGGKPVPVIIWMTKTALADPSVMNCDPASHDSVRCEHLSLISVDSEYYILAVDGIPNSPGVVLPRTLVTLISGAATGNKP